MGGDVFALAKLGGVVVPINYLLKPHEVPYIADDAGLGPGWRDAED